MTDSRGSSVSCDGSSVSRGVSRRRFLQGLGATAGAAVAGVSLPGLARAANTYHGELLVSDWGGDWDSNVMKSLDTPELITQGMRIERDLASAPERKTKILAQRMLPHGSVDVAQFTDADAYELYLQGALETLDYSKIPNAAHLLPHMKTPYFIPFDISGVVLIYNPDKIKTPPTSYADMMKPEYAGRVGLIDQIYFNYFFAFGLLAGGTMSNIEPGYQEMLKLKKAVQPRIYPSHQQAAAAFATGEIWITANYKARATQWKQQGLPVAAAYPKEGAIAFKAGLCVPKNAPNKENAYHYLNAALTPQVAQRMAKLTDYAVPIDNAALPPELAADVAFTPEEQDKLQYFDLDYTAKNQSAWLDWWNKEIKI